VQLLGAKVVGNWGYNPVVYRTIPLNGDLLTRLMNHVLSGMILQLLKIHRLVDEDVSLRCNKLTGGMSVRRHGLACSRDVSNQNR
jgi:hypothetical protein